MSTRMVCWLLPLMIVAGLLPVARAEAASGPWSAPVKVSGTTGGAGWTWFPAIAADDYGNVHIVWNGAFADTPTATDDQQAHLQLDAALNGTGGEAAVMAQFGALYYTRSTDGHPWSQPVDIGLAWWGAAIRSSLAVDLLGRVHLIRLGAGKVTASVSEDLDIRQIMEARDLWYTQAVGGTANGIADWSSPVRLSQSAAAYYSDLAIDKTGTIHAITTESADGAWGLYYHQSADGGKTWSDAVPIEPSQPVWWYRSNLFVDEQRRIHVAWEVLNNVGGYGQIVGMKYALSTDGGKTWKTTSFKASGPAGPQQPAIGVDGTGRILLVYRNPVDEQIYYLTSTDGQSWSAPKPLPGVRAGVSRPYDRYNMATDSAGHVHLVAVGYPANGGQMALLHFEWDGQGWSSPQAIVTAPDYPEYPGIAIGEGNKLHVTWFDGDKASVDRNAIGGIWYSTATTKAPSTARPASQMAKSLPGAPGPAPAAPAPSAQPTATARPDFPPLPPPERLSDTSLLTALAPAVAILVIACLVRLRMPELRLDWPWRK